MGFAAATVRDIIRATPLASGTFYNYFKSKEEVYQALRDGMALAMRPRLREARLAAEQRRRILLAPAFALFFAFVVPAWRDAGGRARRAAFAWIRRKCWRALPSCAKTSERRHGARPAARR